MEGVSSTPKSTDGGWEMGGAWQRAGRLGLGVGSGQDVRWECTQWIGSTAGHAIFSHKNNTKVKAWRKTIKNKQTPMNPNKNKIIIIGN